MAEHDEQAALFTWARYVERVRPELALLLAIPNGGLRSKTTAARLQAEGVRPGVPDVFLPVARGGCHGLWLELKVTGGRLSSAQAQWLAGLRAQGYRALVCEGWQAAAESIEAYLDARQT